MWAVGSYSGSLCSRDNDDRADWTVAVNVEAELNLNVETSQGCRRSID
jgi:hypothetical protein